MRHMKLRGQSLVKKNVKYYILRLIHESLFGIETSKQVNIENELIERFRNLKKNEYPEIFLNLAETAYDDFMLNFNQVQSMILKKRLQEIKNNNFNIVTLSPYEIMYQLKIQGVEILPLMLNYRQSIHKIDGDHIQEMLLTLINHSNPN